MKRSTKQFLITLAWVLGTIAIIIALYGIYTVLR